MAPLPLLGLFLLQGLLFHGSYRLEVGEFIPELLRLIYLTTAWVSGQNMDFYGVKERLSRSIRISVNNIRVRVC